MRICQTFVSTGNILVLEHLKVLFSLSLKFRTISSDCHVVPVTTAFTRAPATPPRPDLTSNFPPPLAQRKTSAGRAPYVKAARGAVHDNKQTFTLHRRPGGSIGRRRGPRLPPEPVVLLLVRTAKVHCPGVWVLPGGIFGRFY